MLFISVEDFLDRAQAEHRLSREEEKALAQRMADGDAAAREMLVRSHFPVVAALIRRAPENIRTLHTVYACIKAVEAAVDSFNFRQDHERFAHHLNWHLRQCITRCIADRP